MPALDQCHEQFVTALRKDGWDVSGKPLHLSIDTRSILIDIFASRMFSQREEQAYTKIFDLPPQSAIEKHGIALVVVAIQKEEIVQWIH